MYLGYRSFGLKGLIVLKALVLAIVFLLVGGLIYRRTESYHWAAAGALLAAWASQYSVHLRPPVLTYLFLAIHLHFLLNIQENKKVLLTQILSGLLMILWINLHGGAIIGIVLSGIYFSALFLKLILLKLFRSDSKDGKNIFIQVKQLGLNLGIVALASFCNPFTYHIHLLTLKVMRDKELVRFISELQMPDLHHTTGYLILLILFFAVGMAAIKRVRLQDAMVALFFLINRLIMFDTCPCLQLASLPSCLNSWQ